MKYLPIVFCLALLPLTAGAQRGTVSFEEGADEIASVGVWDAWEQSPFMTGQLEGWSEVIDNPFVLDERGDSSANTSARVAVFQRSPYGSNQYGVAVQLSEQNRFHLATTPQYVHVLVHRPVKGRLMLMGLGHKTSEAWSSQRHDVLQFAELSNNKGTLGQWSDIVFQVIGRNDVEIGTLVVAVDCESPHALAEPFLAYIDDIVVNTSSTPRVTLAGDYPVCFDADTQIARNDRQLRSVTIGTAAGTAVMENDGKNAYTQAFSRYVPVTAGETITVHCDYTGSWMHSFVYLDANDNGAFDMDGNASELVAYDNGSSNGFNTTHRITIPASLHTGIYRLRAKVDWQDTDPAGNSSDGNHIVNNGGGIIDVLLNVYDPTAMADITNEQRNGDILLADGSKMSNYRHPILQPLDVQAAPAPGFDCAGIVVKHGYNLSGEQMRHSNPQYISTEISYRDFDDDGSYTIPGTLLDGEVAIEGLMVESGTLPVAPMRYTTTKVKNGEFQGTITWHSMQIAQAGYVIHGNGAASSITLTTTKVSTTNDSHLWCFDGDDERGYLIYNRATGTSKVLASSTNTSANTGGNTFPVMVDAGNIPEGYEARWNFSDSQQLGTGTEYAFMYQMGYPANRVNYRSGKLAFWTGGADKGSTLTIREVKTEEAAPAAIRPVEFSEERKPEGTLPSSWEGLGVGSPYDLAGRHIDRPTPRTIFIQSGRKRVE